MRKLLTLISLLVALSIVLTACGGAAPRPRLPPNRPPPPTACCHRGLLQHSAPASSGEKVTLTIESWRNDDLAIWQDKIIPAFEAKYPNIHVEFTPSAPSGI